MRWGRKRRLQPKTHNADYVLALKANHPKLYGQIGLSRLKLRTLQALR